MRVKKTYVMFTVGWEVRYNMRDEALARLDYFVDNDPAWHGKTFMGKEIRSPEVLRMENVDQTVVFVGSLAHRAVISNQLAGMGFKEGYNQFWASNWHGDEVVPPFYYDKNRWPDYYKKNKDLIVSDYFQERAEIIAKMLPWETYHSVLDLAAGAMLIKKHLPLGCRYIPIDFIPYTEETIVCNLDEYEYPTIEETPCVDCAILSGTLELVRDWQWLLQKTSKITPRMIISIVTTDIFNQNYPTMRAKFEHGFLTNIYPHELILFMQSLGYRLTAAKERHQLDNIYLFERVQCGDDNSSGRNAG